MFYSYNILDGNIFVDQQRAIFNRVRELHCLDYKSTYNQSRPPFLRESEKREIYTSSVIQYHLLYIHLHYVL